MISAFLVLVLALVLIGIGTPIILRLDSAGRLTDGERVMLSFLVGGFSIYFGVFFVGLWRLDTTTMSGLAGLCILLAVPGFRKVPWRAIYNNGVDAYQSDFFSKILLATIFAISITTLLQGLAPPNDYDSLMYHLAIPLRDVELGRISMPDDVRGIQALFPALMSNLTRFLLVFTDGETAQLAHGLYGIAAAAGTGFLVSRLGYGVKIALIASLFFLAIRAVIWEMATAETDVPLAAFLVGTIIVYLAWRDDKSVRMSTLFGLMVGGMILVKYIGFALALSLGPLLIYDMVKSRKKWSVSLIGPLVSLLVILPHLLRSFFLTGNPIFPLFNGLFNPGKLDPYGSVASSFGTGRGFVDILTAPWNIFVVPMQYFDGMVMGAPYLLAFFPLVFIDREKAKHWLPILSVVMIFFLIWFYLLTQQVRLLLPLMPIIAGIAAAGVGNMWERTCSNAALKISFISILGILGINQAMFIGVYSAIRLPAAVGIMSVSAFHSNTPTMKGAYFRTCNYIRNHIQPNESYYSGIKIPSFYCPQGKVAYKRFVDEVPWYLGTGENKEYSYDEFFRKIEASNFRYFLIMTGYSYRRDVTQGYKSRKNTKARTIRISADNIEYRFKHFITPALINLKPLVQGLNSAVYDGAEVLANLRKIHQRK